MKLIYLVFSIALVLACNNSKDQKTAKTTAVSATNGPYGLEIPVGWSTDHRRFAGVDYFFILAPKTFDDPNTTINVITEKMLNMTLPDFMAHSIQMVKQSIPTAVIQKQGAVTAQGGIKGLWYSYHMEPEGVKMNVTSYLLPKDGTVYIITASTQEKHAERYRSTFDDLAMSFHFK